MRKQYNNRWVTATVGGQLCKFRSILEYRWCLYQQWLWDNGEITEWLYEYKPDRFYFPNEKTAPVQYLPDFKVTENDGTVVYHECKGFHDGQTNTKFRRVAKHYPDVVMDLILQRIPKSGSKGANRRMNAQRYVRRIINASEIFKQTKGMIDYDSYKHNP